jgi:hypothetical protein
MLLDTGRVVSDGGEAGAERMLSGPNAAKRKRRSKATQGGLPAIGEQTVERILPTAGDDLRHMSHRA